MGFLKHLWLIIVWMAKKLWAFAFWLFRDVTLIILRLVFLVVSVGLAVFVVNSGALPERYPWMTIADFAGIPLLALIVISVDMAFPRKRLETITAVYFGLIVGLFLAYVGRLALTPLFPGPETGKIQAAVQLVLAAILCYLCGPCFAGY